MTGVEQAADTAADELRDRIARALHDVGCDCSTNPRYLSEGGFEEDADAVLPVVVVYADALVAAERERIAAAIWTTIPLPGRDTDVEARAYRDAPRIAARIARGVP